jgi:hypothetical protein
VRRLVALAAVSALCAACGGSPPPPQPVAAIPAAAPVKPAAPAPAGAPAASAAPLVPTPAVSTAEGPVYDPKGRRDPFISLEVTGGPMGLQVSTTKLTGIVRSARTTLALVETTDGIGYILKPGDTLGDGRLLEIGADNVVFALAAKPGSASNRVVLKLAAN